VTFAHEILQKGRYLFVTPTEYDMAFAAKNWKQQSIDLLTEFLPQLQALVEWDAPHIDALFHAFVAQKAVGMGKVMAPLRLALTGVAGGPGCFEIAALISKEETIRRIENAIRLLPAQ
jgi:glutamyl-tRNA synthetase